MGAGSDANYTIQAQFRFRYSAADFIPTGKGVGNKGGSGGEPEDFPFVGFSVEGGNLMGLPSHFHLIRVFATLTAN